MDFQARVKNLINNKYYVTTRQDQELELAELQPALAEKDCSNTIALIETFEFHGECFASYIKYFLELGFNVHLYILKNKWMIFL